MSDLVFVLKILILILIELYKFYKILYFMCFISKLLFCFRFFKSLSKCTGEYIGMVKNSYTRHCKVVLSCANLKEKIQTVQCRKTCRLPCNGKSRALKLKQKPFFYTIPITKTIKNETPETHQIRLPITCYCGKKK